MRTINIIEFYTRFGANPYVYIAIFAAVAVVFLFIGAAIQIFFSRRLYDRMERDDAAEDVLVQVAITGIGSLKTRKVSVTFTDRDDVKYIFSVSNTEATFLSLGEEGVLKFRGTKYIGFGEFSFDEEIEKILEQNTNNNL